MSKTQFHQGSRLQFNVEKSGLTMVEVVEKTGIPRSSLYDLYKKPELLRSKIQSILDVIGIDADDFYGLKSEDVNKLKNENDRLDKEVERLEGIIGMLKQQLVDKEMIIDLLKNNQK